ncbi:ferric-dicitrate binding protein FerR (iron transport regulator) [Pedobacter sp. AK017]|uniref:FecR family protein n=1 Tax=Pedobacter sp. AK017 TaxID=2723073 RepID=UPI001622E196|nr:FecR family protein [Pedobacter sp. AK017]MBB5441285.1 ferric-dicitrate binding protein FerR (iron transport regulator) [Pedobacter sp. AK017]
MQKHNAINLLARYKTGTCTAEEQAIVETFYNQYHPEKAFDLTAEEVAAEMERLGAVLPLYTYSHTEPAPVKSRRMWPRIGVVAAVLLLAGAGLWFYSYSGLFDLRHPEGSAARGDLVKDIAPGKNTATLTLANGKTIELSDAKTGVVVDASSLKYSDGSAIAGRHPELGSESKISGPNMMLTASTPRGGTYQIILPDGTKVWLNASSSLKFPSTFTGLVNREVELSGEAYLEVTKDKKHPFVVKTARQEVEVLGTEFNINSYADEGITKTTLVAGSVAVRDPGASAAARAFTVILKPNQQALNTGTAISVKEVDAESIVAWKNGLFLFYNVDLKTIMRQVARWYDVEVDMATVPDKEFYGEIPRNVPLSQVLTMLEAASKIKFKTEGRRIMVQQ